MELVIKNLQKTYSNGVQALNDVSLTITEGMFGLLGPNGAGKSTLMRTISTLQESDSGTISLNGVDVATNKDTIRGLLGYLPQEFGVYPKVSAVDLLNHIAVLKGVNNAKERKEQVEALLNRVNLYNYRSKHVSSYSGGMKQRFGIAQALLGNPQLIIVDEPTAGLDPGERNRFHNLLAEIGENKIVILSTHIVQDVRELCTQMAIINKGNLLFHGTPDAALEALQGKVWEKQVSKEELPTYFENYKIISNKLIAGKPTIHIYAEDSPAGFRLIEPTLEDVFFSHIV